MSSKRIAIASDHAGFKYKEELMSFLVGLGFEVKDCGTFSQESSDYPDFAKQVAKQVGSAQADLGILVCGSGIGMCMSANRFAGVRAAVLRSEDDAKLSRMHNNANVACFGARITPVSDVKKLLEVFLSTKFEGERHERRVAKIDTQ